MTTNFTVSSADAENGILPYRHFANMFGCSGDNLSPAISWQGAPEGTKSFVVTMYDPDAPTGSGWWHWVVIDIPATVTSLPRGAGSQGGSMPQGAVQTNTDMGAPGYGGACPPVGDTHRYVITVKALNVARLEIPPNATGALVGLLSNMYSLGQATLTLTGSRPA
jgi:Raf kinase inhibitor-like YbhB/YbcL family protein